MNSNEEIAQTEAASRRKFVWGIGILSGFAALVAATGLSLSFFNKKQAIACKPESTKKLIRMLTQDGQLVEIEEALITDTRKKITNNELQNWIKK